VHVAVTRADGQGVGSWSGCWCCSLAVWAAIAAAVAVLLAGLTSRTDLAIIPVSLNIALLDLVVVAATGVGAADLLVVILRQTARFQSLMGRCDSVVANAGPAKVPREIDLDLPVLYIIAGLGGVASTRSTTVSNEGIELAFDEFGCDCLAGFEVPREDADAVFGAVKRGRTVPA
jgi:hypothetical protein